MCIFWIFTEISEKERLLRNWYNNTPEFCVFKDIWG
jgi:hypothetical protein